MTTYPRRQARRLTVALLADGATFSIFALIVGMNGLHTERNPLISAAFAAAGVWGVLALKAGAALLVEWRSRRVASPRRGYLAAYALASSLALAATVVGSGFNVAALVSSLEVPHG